LTVRGIFSNPEGGIHPRPPLATRLKSRSTMNLRERRVTRSSRRVRDETSQIH